MGSPKDPFYPAIIRAIAYCPDSLALLVGFAKLDQLRDHQLTRLHFCHHVGASWEVRRRGGVCVCANERTSVGSISISGSNEGNLTG